MNANTAHKIAMKNAMIPVLNEIKAHAEKGHFVKYFTNSELFSQAREKLIELGYRIESSPAGYYVWW